MHQGRMVIIDLEGWYGRLVPSDDAIQSFNW
jgi:hypothetical protein